MKSPEESKSNPTVRRVCLLFLMLVNHDSQATSITNVASGVKSKNLSASKEFLWITNHYVHTIWFSIEEHPPRGPTTKANAREHLCACRDGTDKKLHRHVMKLRPGLHDKQCLFTIVAIICEASNWNWTEKLRLNTFSLSTSSSLQSHNCTRNV